MFGASRKKFVEGVDSDYHDESMYYSQSSMFPHRSEKDVSHTVSSAACCVEFPEEGGACGLQGIVCAWHRRRSGTKRYTLLCHGKH